MRTFTSSITSHNLEPRNAIIIYTETTAPYSPGSSFATIHDIKSSNDNVPELQPGTLLTAEALADTLTSLGRTTLEFIPQHVLAFNSGTLIWYSPSQKRRLFFHTQDEYLNTRINNTDVLMPALLWHAQGAQLRLYALDSDERPELHSPLYHPPLLNIHSGKVCLGDTVLPKNLSPAATEEYERGFFASAFTHANQPRVKQNHHGTYGQYLNSLQTATVFPTDTLIPMNQTLESILR